MKNKITWGGLIVDMLTETNRMVGMVIGVFIAVFLGVNLLFNVPWTLSDWKDSRGMNGPCMVWEYTYEDKTTAITHRTYKANTLINNHCWVKRVEADNYFEYLWKMFWSPKDDGYMWQKF